MRYKLPFNYVDKSSVVGEELIPSGSYATCFDFIPDTTCTLMIFGKEIPIKGGTIYSIPHQDGFEIRSLKVKENGIKFTLYLGIVD